MDSTLDALASLDSQHMVDCTLACDGGQIEVHKMVLSVCSTYLQGVIQKHPVQHPIIILPSIKINDLRILVNYMYTGELLSDADMPSAGLMEAAKFLGINSIKDYLSKQQQLPQTPPHHSQHHNNQHQNNNQRRTNQNQQQQQHHQQQQQQHHQQQQHLQQHHNLHDPLEQYDDIDDDADLMSDSPLQHHQTSHRHPLSINDFDAFIGGSLNNINNLSHNNHNQNHNNITGNSASNNNNKNVTNMNNNHINNHQHANDAMGVDDDSASGTGSELVENTNDLSDLSPPINVGHTTTTEALGLSTLSNNDAADDANRIRCHLCDIRLSDVKCLYRHVLTRHLPDRWGYRCEFCDREFSRDDHLMRHYTTKHKGMDFDRDKIRETRRHNREMAKTFHDQFSSEQMSTMSSLL